MIGIHIKSPNLYKYASNPVTKIARTINAHSYGIPDQYNIPRSMAPKTRDVPKSGCIKTKIQGKNETKKGLIKWDKSEKLLRSNIEAKASININFANYDGCT